jgi:hypothetical protein
MPMPSSLRVGNVWGKERVEPVAGSKAWLERAARKDRVWRVWRKVRYGRFANIVGSVWRRFTSWGFFRTFFGFRWTTQVILLFMFVSGVILLFDLWTTDLGMDVRPTWLHRYDAAWLRSHAYIANVLAGFTGFLIGAPVGAVILSHFTTEREEKVAIDRVNKLSKLAWYAFRDEVYELASMDRINVLQSTAPIVQKHYREAFEALQDYAAYCGADAQRGFTNLIRAQSRLRKLVQRREWSEGLKAKNDAIVAAVSRHQFEEQRMMRTIRESVWAEIQWARTLSAWNVLDQYIRLQRQERNLKWYDAHVDANICRWMSRPISPLQEFTDLHGLFNESRDQTETMSQTLSRLLGYRDDIAKLANALSGLRGTVYDYSPVDLYNTRFMTASSFLVGLLGAVNDVEIANWPEAASKPEKAENQKLANSLARLLGGIGTQKGKADWEALVKEARADKNLAEKAPKHGHTLPTRGHP